MARLPLEGIRIVDFGWILAVPHATAWLGVMGAEVIKVESAQRLDLVRLLGHMPGRAVDVNGSPYFNGINYGKRGVTLNMQNPKARALARELVRRSDAVTENFTVGNMEKWGLGYRDLCAVKPDIIMLSGTPLGQFGRESACVGWGPHTQAYAGMCHLTGYAGGPPSGLGGTWPDFMIGVVMAYVLLGALHYRRRTGRGQHIDLAMAEVVMSMIPEGLMEYTMNGRERGRMGNRDDIMAPHNVYRCRGEDKWVALAVGSEEEWRALCRASGHPEWSVDPRFADARARKRNEDVLDPLIASWTRERDAVDIMHALQRVGVAATPVYNTAGLCCDPQFVERGYTVPIDHPVTGPVRAGGLPCLYSGIDKNDMRYTAAPCVGQHNEAVFGDLLGLSAGEIASLRDDKVLF